MSASKQAVRIETLRQLAAARELCEAAGFTQAASAILSREKYVILELFAFYDPEHVESQAFKDLAAQAAAEGGEIELEAD